MVSEALDGLTDEELAALELQESGLVSGQNEGAIASTPFAQRMNPTPAPAPEPEEPVSLSDYELNQLEEENYRRGDYVMTPQEFDQMWDRRIAEDNEVGRFIQGLGQGAAGLIGMVPEAGRELRDGMVGMVTDPVNQVQRNVQTGAEIVRKAGVNLVQLYDWVGSKVDDLATSSKRAEAINAGIRAQLQAEGRFTGDPTQDDQIYQAALTEARRAGAYKPTAEQVREDRQTAYQRYVREKSLERDYAAVSQFKTGESQMSSPTTAETYQITDEQPMQTVSQLGAMAIDPVNLIPTGAGALSKARVLRRIATLSEKPLMAAERAAGGLADVAERIETGLSTRIQDITGLTQKQQAALGAGVAGTAVYVDSATESQGGLTKAVMMVGGVLPALHYGGGLLRKVGSAAGGAATVVREAGVGGLGVARAEAAAGLAGNAAIPERYRKFFTGYVEGTDSTLKRVAQNADNPETLRRVSRFADRMGATQVARVADDAVSGAVTAGIVGTPFAALQPDAERAGEVMGGILTLGAAGGVAGGFARRRSPEVADADIARMFADVQASGGNVEAFSRLPHQTLDRLSAMQGVLAGKVDFIPLSGDEYRMNADIAQNAGETTAGVFVDKDTNNRARVFINLDAKTKTESIAPHEIGHAILTSDILDGQPRNDLRNLVNQQYGPEGVAVRGREYIGRLIDGDARAKTTGEMPMVLTEAEMTAVDGGKTMDDVVADRMKDPAERERLINERFEEFSQRSIDKGQDPLDWARDEIIAETFASEAPAIDFRAIRRDGTFPRIAESMLSAGGRVLEMFGANFSDTGRLLDNPSVLFRDNPLFQDRIMQKRVREYVRSYDQFLAGLEEAGSAAPRGVELARSNNPADLGRSTHVKLRDEGRGVLENDFLFQKPDGTYSFKPQKLINQTEASRAAQIKTLYDARKFVPVNSTEFGKRKVNGRETIGGPVLPPQFDLFTHFPKHVREFARAMEQSRAEGGSWDIDYNAIGTGSSGRYRITNMGAVRAIQRETVPFGWQVTKQNHLLAASLDLNAFRASAMKAINKGELGVFNNDMRQVEADLKTYLGNHRSGLPGEAGIGQAKRDMLNGLIGTGTAVQRTANPLYYELNPKGSIRTWRVDRLNDAKPTGRTGYFFDYDKINNNRMPQALPREAMGMPDVPVRGERADIPLNPRARRAAFISDRGEVRSTGRATHFETNEDLGPDFLAIGAGHLGEDGFFRFGSQTMDEAMGESPATSAAAAARFNQSLYDQGRRPSAMLEEPPGLERPAMRGQAMPDAEARSGAAETLDQLKRSQFIPTKVAAEVVGGFPEYLRPVAQFITDQRQKLANGQMTRRDVMKAYAMTVASQGSGARAVEVIANNVAKDGIRFRPSKDFTTVDKKGRAAIRPEEAAAYWLGTDAGQRALDNFEAGRFNPDDWKELVAIRKAYGDDRFNNLGAFNPENIRTMDKVLADLNASRADTGKVMDAVQQLRGIKTGKKGFIAHLLGIGDVPTIDAVEINFWLTGRADIGKLNTRRANLARSIKNSISDKRVSQEMFRRIDQRINALRDEVPGGAEIAPEVWSHVMHHWLWDKSKGIETTHEGMYRAQAQFMADVVVNDEGGTVWKEVQDAPIVSLKDFEGRPVFAAFADLTSAGKIYRGIDSSEIAVPVETHGGPEWPLIQDEPVGQETDVWSNQGAGVTATKAKMAEQGAIMLIAAMHKNAHVSNTETATAVIATNAAYARDGRIAPDNLAALDGSIRAEIPDFPGIESPNIMEYVNKLPFQGKKSRARIAKILESKESQDLGAPNVQRILDEMRSEKYDGLRIGDIVLAIELTPGAPVVKLGEQGTMVHPSYQYAVRGQVLGRFARPINIETVFDDFYAKRRAEGKPQLGDRRAFDLAKPVQVITPSIAARVPGVPYNSFRSPRHAQIIKMALDDKWRSSADAVGKGGVSPAAFVDALNASPAKLALDRYTQDSLKAKIKTGEMSIYQLGDSQVFFGIKQGDPASAYGQDPAAFGFGPDERTLSLVLNNERRTGGMADAIVMKSLQLGVTALDCFAVKSKKNPTGMLPELYENYGFERVGTIPFDPQYYSKTELADLKKYWKSTGWDDSLGLPEIVLMKWKGNNELRTKSLREFAAENSASLQEAVGGRELYTDTRKLAQRNAGKGGKAKRRAGQGDAGSGAGNQGDAGRGVRLSRGFLGAYDELLSLSPEELRNLGIK